MHKFPIITHMWPGPVGSRQVWNPRLQGYKACTPWLSGQGTSLSGALWQDRHLPHLDNTASVTLRVVDISKLNLVNKIYFTQRLEPEPESYSTQSLQGNLGVKSCIQYLGTNSTSHWIMRQQRENWNFFSLSNLRATFIASTSKSCSSFIV